MKVISEVTLGRVYLTSKKYEVSNISSVYKPKKVTGAF